MTLSPRSLLLFVALFLFAVGAFWAPPAGRPFNLVAGGLAFLTLSFLVPG